MFLREAILAFIRLELHYTRLLSDHTGVKIESAITPRRSACSCVIFLRISNGVWNKVYRQRNDSRVSYISDSCDYTIKELLQSDFRPLTERSDFHPSNGIIVMVS